MSSTINFFSSAESCLSQNRPRWTRFTWKYSHYYILREQNHKAEHTTCMKCNPTFAWNLNSTWWTQMSSSISKTHKSWPCIADEGGPNTDHCWRGGWGWENFQQKEFRGAKNVDKEHYWYRFNQGFVQGVSPLASPKMLKYGEPRLGVSSTIVDSPKLGSPYISGEASVKKHPAQSLD